jgi:acetyltransferase-like isoleucine patch superfamily enzyme
MSGAARRLALAALQLALAPLSGLCWLESRRGRSERWFAACGELVSLFPGRLGSMIRKAFYRTTLVSCAERAYLSFGVLIVHRDAEVGRDVYIGPYSIVGCARIGDGVKIASRVSITSGRHQHGRDAVASDPVPTLTPIAVGADSWIGEGAVVMADVGTRCIVGAGSVVVRPVADGAVVAGNPAAVIRQAAGEEAAARARGARVAHPIPLRGGER